MEQELKDIKNNLPKIICLEGNIGSGKSTLLDNLEKEFHRQGRTDVIILREPVDIWENTLDNNGENILKKFYKDPKKYSFPFQVLAFSTIMESLNNAFMQQGGIQYIICERSLMASRNVFAKMLYDDGMIEDMMYNIYENMFNELIELYSATQIIYLDVDPEVCYDRIMKRNRDGEQIIALEYLKKCSKYHEKWLVNENMKEIPILHIIGNEEAVYDIENDKDIGLNWVKQIVNFIE